MSAQVQNTEKLVVKWGKRPPSPTSLRHSLNLCNGYAAGVGANLPCKESPFCTQPLQRKGNRVSGSQWGRGTRGKRSSATCAHLPEWQKVAGGVLWSRDRADLGRSLFQSTQQRFLNLQKMERNKAKAKWGESKRKNDGIKWIVYHKII